jgi:hypothetical protein
VQNTISAAARQLEMLTAVEQPSKAVSETETIVDEEDMEFEQLESVSGGRERKKEIID